MASLIYLATDEGVVTLKSQDGRAWNLESQGLKDWEIPKIAVSASRPNVVFAGTRGDGVWVSEDSGNTWKKPCYGKRGPGKVRCVTLDPRDANTVYAGTEPIDIFVSRDGAKSWERMDSIWNIPYVASVVYPVSTVEPHVRDITIDPENPQTIYAALQVGYMVKSTDGGKSWKLLNKGLDADVHTIVVDPRDPRSLFIATGGHDHRKGTAPGRALYKSRDGGESWEPMAMDFPLEYSVPLAMNPKNPAVIYSALAKNQPGAWRKRPTGAESVVIRTKDGGQTWQKLNGKMSEINKDFAEAIALDPSDPHRVYAALRGGEVYASHDGGDSWEKIAVKVSSVSDMKCVSS
ncbi:MAG TPA: hypothetical protein VL754_15955 [Verrucomicrobiae bacterium]|jgi:photosystem II stability/assembly factor-like uncharacterized protein|nr:hypothetical protein [Verrucomicrobiae bacterium]